MQVGVPMTVCNYEVFLSFRGPDVRCNFLECFYDHLRGSGFTVFLDREKIESGERINTEIVEAIKRSDICIPVLSENFASSAACLMEVAQMVESEKTILPIFYGVKPSVVRHQQGTYGESFVKHEERWDTETIRKWKTALANIAGILGFELEDVRNGYHELVKNVLFRLWQLLKMDERKLGIVATIEHVIGINDRVKDVIKLLEIENDKVKVRVVGIHGTSGIGKTTIAKAVYDRLSSCFDSCSFLAEIGETTQTVGGIQFVQTKLISDILERDGDVASFEGGIKFFLDVFGGIKALIVLDDVEDQSHLDDLVGHSLDWFGSGSRIIVTTENCEILQKYDSRVVTCTYEVNEMDKNCALELFHKHALGTHGSIPGYPEIAKRIVKATGQVPFVIEVVGSLLRGKKEKEWMEMKDLIKPRKESSRKDCWEISKICYEALDEMQKQIFWDIAWFANGMDSRIASYMWPDRDLLPSYHVLMPLAKIGDDNILQMHKLLKCLSKTIDQEENKYPRRRSRQYMHVTDLEVFNRKEGMEEVEALCFDLKNHPHKFTKTDFESMPNIRFLKLDHASVTGNFANVFPKLRWLRWQGCPRDFKATEFSLTELVILDLSWSKVTEDWGGWRLFKMEQLKVLNLTGCTDLLISPTFSSFPNLEILILERCSRLVHLDLSVGGLKKLLCLNLKSCTELNRLPAELGALKALKELLIDETSVRDIPLGGDLKNLEILSASNCVSLCLPDKVGELLKLRRLSLRNCHWIRKLPESIGQLGSPLEELDISGTGISELPDSFGNLQRLRVLKMDDCFISKFPSFTWHLHSLEEIHASSCRNLKGEIPGDIRQLINLRILRLQYSAISSLPPEIKHLSKLETLDVLHCNMLSKLSALPSGLDNVHLSPKLVEAIFLKELPSSSSLPSSNLAGDEYEVFLSFKKPETSVGITVFLYESLTDAGISVFPVDDDREDDELSAEEEIKPAAIEVIKRSEVLIPIISRDYASSKSCLMELVQILECRQTLSRAIIPIFYEIKPSDMRHQRNFFEKSFLEHERNGVDSETIKKWKLALAEIAMITGFETEKINGHLSKLIDELIPIVQQKLKKDRLSMTRNLVGVDHHVQEIMRKLGVVHHDGQVIEIRGSDVRVLGIYGIGGVGKTTLAKVVYNKLYHRFQGSSYLKEIRELYQQDRILSLQNQLISDLCKRSVAFRCSDDAMAVLAERFCSKRVLILLDDVEDVDQLDVVVGELRWFGPGSRIIVTSRRSDILLKFKEAETYEVEPMEEDKALQLFSKGAFGRDYPSKGFESLSRDIVSATGRLPLALAVTGSGLFGKSVGTWKDTLEELKDTLHEEVESVLKRSYDALDIYTKQIFLDIACFLIGKDERIAFYMWEDCKLYPSSGIEVLLVMSFVKIGENNELLMHDVLRTLGRKIVLNEDPIPYNRSRLWVHDEALSTLRRKEGTPNVQALGLTFDKRSDDDCFTSKEFGTLSNLRFLNLDRANMRGNFTSCLLELRWLHWRGCHESSEPLVLCLENLVILDLSWSAVADDWEGWTQIMEKAKKLKVLELTSCGQLCKTPCFPPGSKLERLILERCSHLSLIDKSIGNLKYLKSLNIKSTMIALLPKEMGSLDNLEELLIDKTSICHLHISRGSMQQLKTLSASSCKNLAEISESIGRLMSLSYLALDESIIRGLPNSVKLLEGLAELSLRDCQRITALPDSVGMLKSLQKMDLSNTRIKVLPESIKNLDKLEVLRMNNTPISTFPKDIANLGKLQVITFSGCWSMNGNILCDISGLSSLRIFDLSFTLISSLPESICQLSHLQTLHLLGCYKLQNLPTLPSSLVSLRWGTKNMRIGQGFSYLRDLKVLKLVNDYDEEISSSELSQTESFAWISSLSNLESSSELSQTENFAWISSLSNLETLKLCLPNVISLPEDFNALTRLKKLDLSCIDLLDLPQLPSSLSKLLLKNCQIQGMDFSNLETLSKLELCDCNAWEILGLGNLRLLQVLKISRCNIRNLDGLEQASQLRRFSMSECYCLDRLPDLSECTSLEIKEIDFCNIQDQP